jgi:hypothetical protein
MLRGRRLRSPHRSKVGIADPRVRLLLFRIRLRTSILHSHGALQASEVLDLFVPHHLRKQHIKASEIIQKASSPNKKQSFSCANARPALSRMTPRLWGPRIRSYNTRPNASAHRLRPGTLPGRSPHYSGQRL